MLLDHRPSGQEAVRAAIATIGDDAWTTIQYTNAIFDEDQQRWISDVEVAETGYTAFTSKPKAKHVTARLIVRRVKDMNPDNQNECQRLPPPRGVHQQPAADAPGREGTPAHAIVEQVIADL